jgi:hypothetical protein
LRQRGANAGIFLCLKVVSLMNLAKLHKCMNAPGCGYRT